MPITVEILWHQHRRLFLAAAPPLVLAWLIDHAVAWFAAEALLDHQLRPGTGVLTTALVWGFAWLVALTAALPVAAAWLRGAEISAPAAIRWGLRGIRGTAVWFVGVAAALLLVGFAALCLAVVGTSFGLVLGLAILVGGVLLICGQPVLSLPVRLLEGSGAPVTRTRLLLRGRTLGASIRMVLVLLALPALGFWAAAAVRGAATPGGRLAGGLLAGAGECLVLLGVVVLVTAQACTIVRTLLAPRDPGDARAVADLPSIDVTLAEIAAAETTVPARWAVWRGRAAPAGLAAAVLLVVAVPVANPAGLTVTATHRFDQAALAMGHAPDGTLVIVDQTGVTRCRDRACDQAQHTEIGHFDAASVNADGTFVALTHSTASGGLSKDQPRFHRCTADGNCTAYVMPVEGVSGPTAAVIVALPGGSEVLAAFLLDRGDSGTGGKLSAWRCGDDARCVGVPVELGRKTSLFNSAGQLTPGHDEHGRPLITWTRGHDYGPGLTAEAQCVDDGCSSLVVRAKERPSDRGTWAALLALDAAGGRLVVLRRPAASDCFEWCLDWSWLDSPPRYSVARCGQSCAVPGRDVTLFVAGLTTPDRDVHVAVGPGGELAMMLVEGYDTVLVTCTEHCDLSAPTVPHAG
ncbi:hypothetical protein F4553_000524 [Allocatelliglobosispora scoriae]|uniref:Uncharacterized protein n=1 Tax=Allocatelliglobosispora scoriae TaxID=643052 RepID=A0A841BHP4_9ACTN|nr:mechanosensitive ion channel family protein [Allocatelliglobosispora scoriae]MBB5867145.1 hypothetical protein [Allocatelliglobosispora scoriae]